MGTKSSIQGQHENLWRRRQQEQKNVQNKNKSLVSNIGWYRRSWTLPLSSSDKNWNPIVASKATLQNITLKTQHEQLEQDCPNKSKKANNSSSSNNNNNVAANYNNSKKCKNTHRSHCFYVASTLAHQCPWRVAVSLVAVHSVYLSAPALQGKADKRTQSWRWSTTSPNAILSIIPSHSFHTLKRCPGLEREREMCVCVCARVNFAYI